MKKAISNQLLELAKALPPVWEDQHPEVTYISGAELNLCAKGKPYVADKLYQYKVPVQILVCHYTRLKDGVKRHGISFITTYTNQVIN